MSKTIFSILLVFLTLSMIACGSTAAPSDTSEDSSSKPDITLTEPEASTAGTEEPIENKTALTVESYEIGDIVLADSSKVKAVDLSVLDSGNVPISVIAGFHEDGTAFGIGVHRSETPLQWASDKSAGYTINFTSIVCTQDSEFDFSGDKNGADNWNEICTQDQRDTADAEANYPAFHFVNTYAASYGLSGEFASGWYMPSIDELCDIYQNRETINNSLQHICALDDEAAMNGLETNWYWSSSQAGSEDDYAWFVHYFNGYAGECPKNFTNVHALAVRRF